MTTVLSIVVAAGFGAVLAVIGAFWQSGIVVIGSLVLPIGLLGALLITWSGSRVTASLTDGRSAAVAVAIGWVLTVLALTSSTSAGDVVVPATWYGYTFLVGGLIIVIVGALRAAPLLPTASDRATDDR